MLSWSKHELRTSQLLIVLARVNRAMVQEAMQTLNSPAECGEYFPSKFATLVLPRLKLRICLL